MAQQKIGPELSALYRQMLAFSQDLDRFLQDRQNTLQNLKAFIDQSKKAEAELDPSDAVEHCQLRQLVYVRRVAKQSIQLAEACRGVRQLPRINQERMSHRGKLPRREQEDQPIADPTEPGLVSMDGEAD